MFPSCLSASTFVLGGFMCQTVSLTRDREESSLLSTVLFNYGSELHPFI